MGHFKGFWGWLAIAVSIAGLMVWLGSFTPVLSQPSVQLQTDPPLNQVIPFSEPVHFQVQALDATGQPLSNVNLQMRLLTPAKTPWLTSDFPHVEGTTLLEFGAIAPSGQVQFEQTLPIRGQYQLIAAVSPARPDAFEPFEQTLSFRVPENPVKYRNFAVIAVILVGTGFIGGWLIGGDQTTELGGLVPERVQLLLVGATILAIAVLLIVNISAELASAHTGHHETPAVSAPAAQQINDIQARLTGDQLATVGQLSTQTVQVREAQTNLPLSNIRLQVEALALESNARVFAFEGKPDETGQLIWQQQFFDGAPHQVVVQVLPAVDGLFEPFQIAHEVEVRGLEPPLFVRFVSLIYFTAFFVAGLVAGLWLHQRQTRLGN